MFLLSGLTHTHFVILFTRSYSIIVCSCQYLKLIELLCETLCLPTTLMLACVCLHVSLTQTQDIDKYCLHIYTIDKVLDLKLTKFYYENTLFLC